MNKKGFSLIEMIFVVTFVALLTLFVAGQYVSGTGIFNEQSKKIFLSQDIRHFSKIIANDIRQALIIENSWTDPEEGVIHQTGTSKIVLALPSVDSNGNWIYEGPTLKLDYIVYWQHNNKLWRRIYSHSNHQQRKPLSSKPVLINLKNLNFNYEPHPSEGITRKVVFSLGLSTPSRNKEIEANITKSVKLRNR